jgi:hypothetical protein
MKGFKYRTAKNNMSKKRGRRSNPSKNTTNTQKFNGDSVSYTTHNPKIPAKINHGVHSFVRKANFGQILSSNSAPVFGAYAFKLSDFPNYTEFSALYDQFRITSVDVQFLHLTTAITNTNSAGSIVIACPRFLSVLDYDGATAPASLDELRQYNNCIAVNADTSYIRSFIPASLSIEYIGVTNGYSPQFGKWHDVAYSTIPHYGLRYALDNTAIAGPNASFGYNVEVTMHLEFRNSR